MNTIGNPLSATLMQLQDLLIWPDGWNSYDALAPNPKAVAHATEWITELYQYLISLGQKWIVPNVTASADGVVTITWRNSQRMLEILIDEQDIDYLQAWSKDLNSTLTDGDIHSVNDMHQLWQWLLETGKDKEV